MAINPMQIMQLLRGGNPQQIIMSMLQQQSGNDPLLNNLLQMAQQGNMQGIEQIARTIVSERGLDYDTEFNKFKQQYGLEVV